MTHVRVLDFSFGFVWLERWKMVGGKIGRIKNILVFSDIYLVEMMEKYKTHMFIKEKSKAAENVVYVNLLLCPFYAIL